MGRGRVGISPSWQLPKVACPLPSLTEVQNAPDSHGRHVPAGPWCNCAAVPARPGRASFANGRAVGWATDARFEARPSGGSRAATSRVRANLYPASQHPFAGVTRIRWLRSTTPKASIAGAMVCRTWLSGPRPGGPRPAARVATSIFQRARVKKDSRRFKKSEDGGEATKRPAKSTFSSSSSQAAACCRRTPGCPPWSRR